MYTVKREKTCTSFDGNGNIKTCYLMHITVDAIADIPDAKENWLAGSRCDVLEDGGHVYMLSNSREWVKVNFHNLGGEGGSTDLSDYYTMSQTDERITEKIAEIVADAPEDFDTLKELSNWIYSHEDSAAAMNTQIQQNTTDISKKVDKIPGMGLSQNSFTNAEKTKLAGLANYDDSNLQTQIQKLALKKKIISTKPSYHGNITLTGFTTSNSLVASVVTMNRVTVNNIDTNLVVNTWISDNTWRAHVSTADSRHIAVNGENLENNIEFTVYYYEI